MQGPIAVPVPATAEEPEYRINFGTAHRGKTLLEVPEGYIKWLRNPQRKNLLNIHPDLKVALELHTSSSTPTKLEPSVSTHPTETQNTRKRSPPRDEDTPPAKIQKQASSYRVHFGQYEGKELSEVPPDVLQRWKKNIDKPGFRQATPGLRAALLEFSLPSEKERTADLPNEDEIATQIVKRESTYVVGWGQHEGKTFSEVPELWLEQLRTYHENSHFMFASPDLKAALQELSRVKGLEKEATLVEQGTTYVLPFGIHKGRRLSEVPPKYVSWLKDNIDIIPNLSNPALRAALLELSKIPSKAVKEVPKKPAWIPPSLRSAPYRFVDDWKGELIWIASSDAKKFFGMDTKILSQVPAVNNRARRKRYWLYYVWDLFKFSTSEAKANAAMEAFLNKNDERTEEIWDGMGLGACLLNDNM